MPGQNQAWIAVSVRAIDEPPPFSISLFGCDFHLHDCVGLVGLVASQDEGAILWHDQLGRVFVPPTVIVALRQHHDHHLRPLDVLQFDARRCAFDDRVIAFSVCVDFNFPVFHLTQVHEKCRRGRRFESEDLCVTRDVHWINGNLLLTSTNETVFCDEITRRRARALSTLHSPIALFYFRQFGIPDGQPVAFYVCDDCLPGEIEVGGGRV
jgi:hypothetical protein